MFSNQKGNAGKHIKTFLIGANFFLLIGILCFVGIRKSIKFEYIDHLPTGAPYEKTKYIYEWPNNVGVVHDDKNLIKTIYGYDPIFTKIAVIDGVRIITFVNAGAILKTNRDSIQIDQKDSRYMGYMGAWTDCREFSINSDGIVFELCD